MRILTRKEEEKIEDKIFNLSADLKHANEQIGLYEEQVKYLQNKVSELQDNLEVETTLSDDLHSTIEKYEIKLKSQRDALRKLKTLLTKNNIDYKAVLEKKGK